MGLFLFWVIGVMKYWVSLIILCGVVLFGGYVLVILLLGIEIGFKGNYE